MRRKPSAAEDRSESPTELIERISAERGSPAVTPSRHRRSAGDAVVTSDPLPDHRPLARKLAPLAVGAAVMLIATTIATVVRPTDDATLAAPELSSTIIRNETETPPVTTTLPPTTTVAPSPSTTKTAPKTKPKAPKTPAAPRRPAAPGPSGSGGDGTQAASTQGWTLVGGDEFNGGKGPTWGVYNGAGHAGNGRRTSDAISVENGALVIRGDGNGNTGGMAWKDGQRFGKWEMRAKFPKGDRQYHPVLILWPTDVDWPEGGEVDFAETTSASDKVSFFLHYGASNQQKYAHKSIDITQWHNYAVEWVDGRITGFVDGEKWFESTDGATMPPGRMHATVQLDYFPDGGSPQPTEMYVDYMRIYR